MGVCVRVCVRVCVCVCVQTTLWRPLRTPHVGYEVYLLSTLYATGLVKGFSDQRVTDRPTLTIHSPKPCVQRNVARKKELLTVILHYIDTPIDSLSLSLSLSLSHSLFLSLAPSGCG